MIHFHSIIDYRVAIKSSILLFVTLGFVLAIDLTIQLNQISRLYFYAAPFLFHVIVSLFIKKKESWIAGAICSTLICMVLFVMVFFLFLS